MRAVRSVVVLAALALLSVVRARATVPPPDAIPQLDLAGETGRQFIVDREPGQYLGHPTTVMLEDGRTILCVYPKAHGKGPIVLKRSTDGGRTWSPRLPVPENWATSLETPTITASPMPPEKSASSSGRVSTRRASPYRRTTARTGRR